MISGARRNITRVFNCLFRIIRYRAAGEYGARSFKAQIKYRRKIRIEAQRARFQSQDCSMHAKELAIAGGKYVRD